MTMPTKGSRRIHVDGFQYLWLIRRKPTYGEAIGESSLVVAVELEESSGSTLLLEHSQNRSDSWVGPSDTSVTPSMVAAGIRSAIQRGWIPQAPGKTFRVAIG